MHSSLTRQLGYLLLGMVLALALTVGLTTLAYADTGTTTTQYVFDAHLSGANQVPPVSATTSTSTNGMGTTTATTTGHARVWFDMTNASGSATTSTMMWKSLYVWNGDDITAAHLHCGAVGTNGPVVLDLIHIASSTDVNGVLVATSSASMSDLHATTTGCSMPITNLTDLGNALKTGIIYANVHSAKYPNGVVRGQMTLTSQSSTSTSTSTPPIATTTPPVGTTTPPTFPGFPGGLPGLGGSINGLIANIFGQLHAILQNFLPTIPDLPGMRGVRTLR